MLNGDDSATNQTSNGREDEREARRQAILNALRADAEGILARMADELVDLPEDKSFGQIEYDLRELPLYDGDVEAAGDPEPVAAFKQAIREADALLIATPEYNRGIPGVLKNAVDWASRPALASPLTAKPIAIMGASTGRGGTARAQEQLRAALEFSRATVLEQPEVLVPEAYMRFDQQCELVDGGVRAELAELLDTLVAVAGGVTLAA